MGETIQGRFRRWRDVGNCHGRKPLHRSRERERGVLLYRQTANILPSFIYVLGGKSQRNIYQWRENGEWFCQENNTISEVYTNTNVPFVALSTIKAPHPRLSWFEFWYFTVLRYFHSHYHFQFHPYLQTAITASYKKPVKNCLCKTITSSLSNSLIHTYWLTFFADYLEPAELI